MNTHGRLAPPVDRSGILNSGCINGSISDQRPLASSIANAKKEPHFEANATPSCHDASRRVISAGLHARPMPTESVARPSGSGFIEALSTSDGSQTDGLGAAAEVAEKLLGVCQIDNHGRSHLLRGNGRGGVALPQ
jgi:hypothetical protein